MTAPTFVEPHDCILARRIRSRPASCGIASDPFAPDRRDGDRDGIKLETDNKVIRDGNKVWSI